MVPIFPRIVAYSGAGFISAKSDNQRQSRATAILRVPACRALSLFPIKKGAAHLACPKRPYPVALLHSPAAGPPAASPFPFPAGRWLIRMR